METSKAKTVFESSNLSRRARASFAAFRDDLGQTKSLIGPEPENKQNQ